MGMSSQSLPYGWMTISKNCVSSVIPACFIFLTRGLLRKIACITLF